MLGRASHITGHRFRLLWHPAALNHTLAAVLLAKCKLLFSTHKVPIFVFTKYSTLRYTMYMKNISQISTLNSPTYGPHKGRTLRKGVEKFRIAARRGRHEWLICSHSAHLGRLFGAAFSIETSSNVLQNFLSPIHDCCGTLANCFDTERSLDSVANNSRGVANVLFSNT